MVFQPENLVALVIDDDEVMRTLLCAFLDSMGAKLTFSASSAEEGLSLLIKHNPDIILCDWEMPKLNGLDFTKKVRVDPVYPNKNVPIILVTGHAEQGKLNIARDAGVTEFLVKPVLRQDLVVQVETALTHPQSFIETTGYIGPSRRRETSQGVTPKKRRSDDEPS